MAHVTATADNRTSTCQVQFDVGEPDRRPKTEDRRPKTEAEAELAKNRDLGSARLPHQIEAGWRHDADCRDDRELKRFRRAGTYLGSRNDSLASLCGITP